jgi:predicted signal transduction protein with EAL and GGDEF domain
MVPGARFAPRVPLSLAYCSPPDDEEPSISVSSGIAIYPQDGTTIDELFGAADRTLYAAKDSSKGKLLLPT